MVLISAQWLSQYGEVHLMPSSIDPPSPDWNVLIGMCLDFLQHPHFGSFSPWLAGGVCGSSVSCLQRSLCRATITVVPRSERRDAMQDEQGERGAHSAGLAWL